MTGAQLQWQQANPLYGPGCIASTDGVYRIDRSERVVLAAAAPGIGPIVHPLRWKLYVGGVFHDEYPRRRDAKAAAQAYDDAHPWDRTGHR